MSRPAAQSAYRRLTWKPIPRDVRTFVESLAEEETDPFLRAFLDANLSAPSVPGAADALEEFVDLVRAAAEIEHALMVQYLYAWLTSDIEVFRAVAIQEMGHFFSMQNLLSALGQPVHLLLPEPVTSPAQDTYPFPLQLAPASRRTLAQYVTAESPLPATLPEPQRTQAKKAAVEAALDVRHVGILFLKLYWVAQPTAQPFGPWTPPLTERWAQVLGRRHVSFQALHIEAQRSWSTSWDVPLDQPDFLSLSAAKRIFVGQFTSDAIGAAEQACRLFYSIGTQGEGYVSDPDITSHFEAFLELYENWEAEPRSLVSTVTNPWIGPPSTDPAREASRLTHDEAVALARAFNLRYERILLLIALTFAPEVTDPLLIRTILQQARNLEMRTNLVTLAHGIFERPAKAGGDATALRAGPPFSAPTVPVDLVTIRERLAAIRVETEVITLPADVPPIDTVSDQALLDQLGGF